MEGKIDFKMNNSKLKIENQARYNMYNSKSLSHKETKNIKIIKKLTNYNHQTKRQKEKLDWNSPNVLALKLKLSNIFLNSKSKEVVYTEELNDKCSHQKNLIKNFGVLPEEKSKQKYFDKIPPMILNDSNTTQRFFESNFSFYKKKNEDFTGLPNSSDDLKYFYEWSNSKSNRLDNMSKFNMYSDFNNNNCNNLTDDLYSKLSKYLLFFEENQRKIKKANNYYEKNYFLEEFQKKLGDKKSMKRNNSSLQANMKSTSKLNRENIQTVKSMKPNLKINTLSKSVNYSTRNTSRNINLTASNLFDEFYQKNFSVSFFKNNKDYRNKLFSDPKGIENSNLIEMICSPTLLSNSFTFIVSKKHSSFKGLLNMNKSSSKQPNKIRNISSNQKFQKILNGKQS